MSATRISSIVFGLMLLAVSAFNMASAFPRTTTTSRTVIGEQQPVQVESAVGSCRCCRLISCGSALTPYNDIMRSYNFFELAFKINNLCDEVVPLVQQCLEEEREDGCYGIPVMFMYQSLCTMRSEMHQGIPCWASGFQTGYSNCMHTFRYDGPRVGACQAVYNLKQCAQDMMENIDQCSRSDIIVIINFVHNNTLAICPNPLPFPV